MTPVLKNTLPILEYDDTVPAIIEPGKVISKVEIPQNAVICFFSEVFDNLKSTGKLKLIKNLYSEIGAHPVYVTEFSEKLLAVFHPGVGAPLAAGLMEEVIALGCNKFVACGVAGVLNKELTAGHIVVPDSAIRDEGTSYHYIAAEREIKADPECIEAVVKILKKHNYNYIIGKTWTTDAIYRETPGKIKLRKQEGCLTVEMEVSAFLAVSKFRGVKFAQILYGVDDVSSDEWDSRKSLSRNEIREKLFWLAAEACLEL